MPDQFINDIANLRRDNKLMMLGREFVRDDAGVFEFVVTILVKANRESLHGPIRLARHQSNYCAGIYTTGEKSAQRNISHQPHADRVVKQSAELFQTIFFVSKRFGLRVLIGEVPILLNINAAIL